MLLREGLTVWGTAREVARLESFSSEKNFSAVVLDLADGPKVEEVFQRASEAAGSFDLVINNAGFGVFAPFDCQSADDVAKQVSTALLGPLHLAHAAVRVMKARNRGCLVNVSSVAVEFPLPFMMSYNVTKAGLSALSESLMFEMRGSHVTVLDFRPGDYRTNFNRAMHVNPTQLETTAEPRLARVWRTLESNLAAAPAPEKAASDLRRALSKGRSGTVYSGGFFQTRLAPLWARLAPLSLRRAIAARYFGA